MPAPRNDPPLLLVAPQSSQALAATAPWQVDWGIRLPATDLQTWDRWYAMDLWQNVTGATAAVRATVWAGVYRNAPGSQTGVDVSIDDPAVSGFLVELVPLLVETIDGVPRAVETGTVPRPNIPIPQTKLPDVQTAPVAVTLNVLPSDSSAAAALKGPRLSVSGQTVSVSVTEQEIWELRFYPMVLASFFTASTAPGTQRFHELFGSDLPAVTALSASQRLFAPWRVVIEGTTSVVVLPDPGSSPPAAGSVPPADRFFAAVKPDFAANTVTVTLAKEDPALDPFAPRRYRYVAASIWRARCGAGTAALSIPSPSNRPSIAHFAINSRPTPIPTRSRWSGMRRDSARALAWTCSRTPPACISRIRASPSSAKTCRMT